MSDQPAFGPDVIYDHNPRQPPRRWCFIHERYETRAEHNAGESVDPDPIVELRKAIEFCRDDDEPIRFTASDGTKYILTNRQIVRLLDDDDRREAHDSEPDLSRGMWQIIL